MKKKRIVRWNDTMYITIYDLARQGHKNTAIAEVLGVTPQKFKRWIGERPAIKEALIKARKGMKGRKVETISEYVYNRLPAYLQDVWNELEQCESEPNSLRRMELILANQGEKAKQYLFVHALISNNFNTSEACRRVNVSRKMLERWTATDADFAELVTEITVEIKRDLVESALMGLVRQGDSSAIIFASKSLNRARGYGDKTEVHHTGSVVHGQVSLDELGLTIEEKRLLLKKCREHNGVKEVTATLVPALIEVRDEDKEKEESDQVQ